VTQIYDGTVGCTFEAIIAWFIPKLSPIFIEISYDIYFTYGIQKNPALTESIIYSLLMLQLK